MKTRQPIARFTAEITLSASATEAAIERFCDFLAQSNIESAIDDAVHRGLARLPGELQDLVDVRITEVVACASS